MMGLSWFTDQSMYLIDVTGKKVKLEKETLNKNQEFN